MYYRENDTRNALFAFLAGLATGGIVVALTTPRSGPELRRDITRQGRKLKGRIADLLERGEATLEDYADDLRSTGKDMGDRASRAMEDARETASRLGSDLGRGAERVSKDIKG